MGLFSKKRGSSKRRETNDTPSHDTAISHTYAPEYPDSTGRTELDKPETTEDVYSHVPYSLRVMAAWSWRAIVVAVVAVGLVMLIQQVSLIIISLFAALLIAVLLEPIAAFFRRKLRFPSALAALTALIVGISALAGLLTFAGRALVDGMEDLYSQAVDGIDQLVQWLGDGPLGIDSQQLSEMLDTAGEQIRENSGVLVTGVASVTSGVISTFTGLFVALFCLFFFLKDGRRLWHWFVRLAPVGARDKTNESGIRAWYTMSGYAQAQILVAAVDGIGIGVGAWILGVPLALPLGVLVFVGAFIPIIGALVTGAVAVLIALVDQGLTTAIIMLIIVVAVQQLEGNILQPVIQSRAVSLHPVAVLLAVTAGTTVAGIVGAIFAVPLVAMINHVILYLVGRDPLPRLATNPTRAGGPVGAWRAGSWSTHDGDTAPVDTTVVPPQAEAAREEKRQFDVKDTKEYLKGGYPRGRKPPGKYPLE